MFFSRLFRSNIVRDFFAFLPVYLAVMALLCSLDFTNFSITNDILIATTGVDVKKDMANLISFGMIMLADVAPAIRARFSKVNYDTAYRTVRRLFTVGIVMLFIYLVFSKIFSYDLLFQAEDQSVDFSFGAPATFTEITEKPNVAETSEMTVVYRYIYLIGQGSIFPFGTSILAYGISLLRKIYVERRNLEKILRKRHRTNARLLAARKLKESSSTKLKKKLLDEEFECKLKETLNLKNTAKTEVRNIFIVENALNVGAYEYIQSQLDEELAKDNKSETTDSAAEEPEKTEAPEEPEKSESEKDGYVYDTFIPAPQ